jgi:hypothetical protein
MFYNTSTINQLLDLSEEIEEMLKEIEKDAIERGLVDCVNNEQ